MSSKNNYTLSGIVFIALFVLPQIVLFIFMPYINVILFNFLIFIVAALIGLKLPLYRKRYRIPFFFMLVSVTGSFMTFFNGSSLGTCLFNSFYAFIGYVGFVYISEKRINLSMFNVLTIILYIFFFFSYFTLDEFTRKSLDGNLFGMSSSNTIAISLNVVLILNFLLSKDYNKTNKKTYILIAFINLTLIVIQGSRAGIIVAFLLLLLISSELYNFRKKYLALIMVSIISFVLIYMNYEKLNYIVEIDRMQGLKSLEEDIRGTAQRSFFSNLNFYNFFLGYPSGTEFATEITRTFNALIDFWNKFGFIPFFFLVVLFARRILLYNEFNIYLIYFIPLLIYSFVESFWGGNLWDILIYFLLFYSYKSNEVIYQTNPKTL